MPASDNCLFLHASSVVVDGGACLFLGHSTAGKSTIARRLESRFPLLADDTVLAVPDSCGDWLIMDGKARHGDRERWIREALSESNQKNRFPLRSCMRIWKSDAVRLAPIEPIELARFLMDAVMEVDLQRGPKSVPDDPRDFYGLIARTRQERKRWFQIVANIARRYPGWHLWFCRESHLDELAAAVTTPIG